MPLRFLVNFLFEVPFCLNTAVGWFLLGCCLMLSHDLLPFAVIISRQ